MFKVSWTENQDANFDMFIENNALPIFIWLKKSYLDVALQHNILVADTL